MIECCPPQMDKRLAHQEQNFAAVDNVLNNISQFGMQASPTRCFIAGCIERHGLATARYQFKGKREIAIVNWACVKEMIGESGKTQSLPFMQHIETHFQNMTNADVQTVLEHSEAGWGGGPPIQRLILNEGSFCYIPAGYFVSERVVDNGPVIGLRVSSFDKVNKVQFAEMVAQHAEKESLPDPILAQFWEKLLKCMNAAGETRAAA